MDHVMPANLETTCTEAGLDGDRLARVLDFIATNFRTDLTIQKLASIACYSSSHFSRKFTLTVGLSPRQYIGRLRLEKAMEELRAGRLSLAEIAFNARFSSQASFTRAFRRATGATPKEYLRRKRSGAEKGQSTRTLKG